MLNKGEQKYAVARMGGKQYKITENSEVLVDKIKDLKNFKPEVLLFVDGKDVKIGKPVLTDVKVSFKVLEEVEKGIKLDIYRFKAKSRYRKHTGFRAQHTRLEIGKIS